MQIKDKVGAAVTFIVMRRACLMEDEGRHEFMGIYPTREAAAAWITAQKGQYFKPGDYYIAEAEGQDS
jgi:hypothetical protein